MQRVVPGYRRDHHFVRRAPCIRYTRYMGRGGAGDERALATDATLQLFDEGGRAGARQVCLLGLLVGGGKFGTMYRPGAFDGILVNLTSILPTFCFFLLHLSFEN